MKVKRNYERSAGRMIAYNTGNKFFLLGVSPTNEIRWLTLANDVDYKYGGRMLQGFAYFRPTGLLYLENICHGSDNEELDLTALMLYEDSFKEFA